MHLHERYGMSRRRAYGAEQRKTCMIQSKVTPETMARLDAVVRKYGFGTRYELMRYIVLAFLSYADPEGETDGQSVMPGEIGRIFDGCEDACRREAVVSEVERLDVTDALLFYATPAGCPSCRRISRADGRELSACSAPAILQTVLQRVLPQEYEYLRHVADELGSSSVLVALDYLIEADKRVGAYQDAGYAMNEYGNVPVRHHARHIDG